MSNWKDFEKECCDYLNSTYGNNGVSFLNSGASDSTAPDIVLRKNGEQLFNIEVKMPIAQSGQFVVLNDGNEFIFSSKNKSNANDAEAFVEYMNNNFEKFKDVSTDGINVNMPEDEYLKWMVCHYMNKNEKFVITKGKLGFIIFPIEKYVDYFQTSCLYRIKDSGSTNVPHKYYRMLENHFSGEELYYDGKYLVLRTKNKHVEKSKFEVGGVIFIISDKTNDGYKLTKKGKTQNPNIIFTIKLKQEQQVNDLNIFADSLR